MDLIVYDRVEIRQDRWFANYWADHCTKEFLDWWFSYYGKPDQFDLGTLDGYWTRTGFALMGWLARNNELPKHKPISQAQEYY